MVLLISLCDVDDLLGLVRWGGCVDGQVIDLSP